MVAVNIRINPIGGLILFLVVCALTLYSVGLPARFRSDPKIKMKELLSVSIDLAIRGGVQVKKVWEERRKNSIGPEVKGETKEGAKELKTTGDMRSHRAMLHGFIKAYPKLKVISEEFEAKPFDLKTIEEPKKDHAEVADIEDGQEIPSSEITVWIDPLDATQEYTEGLHQYVTTMVCVAVRGQPRIGVIHFPFQDETVWGSVGYTHSKSLLKETSTAASEKSDNDKDKPYNIIVSRSHSGTVTEIAKKAFGEKTNVIPAGGAGYKTVQVIRGNVDAYVHKTYIKKWDTCAGNAIILSVQGKMTTLENRSINYRATDPYIKTGLLATMRDHEKFIKSLKAVPKEEPDDAQNKNQNQ